VPRAVFDQAIAAHCRERWPYQSDCENPDCRLYDFRNPIVRMGKTKAAVKKAIRLECRECVGGRKDICTSPDYGLYPVRFGRNPEEFASGATDEA
jgi:hypothetical protein